MQRFSEQTVPNTSSIVIGPASDWQEILIWSSDWLLAPDLPELTGGADKRKVGHICQVIMYGGDGDTSAQSHSLLLPFQIPTSCRKFPMRKRVSVSNIRSGVLYKFCVPLFWWLKDFTKVQTSSIHFITIPTEGKGGRRWGRLRGSLNALKLCQLLSSYSCFSSELCKLF